MVEILNRQQKLVAVLQNATNVCRHTLLNSLATASFELPYNDPKLKECIMRRYVRITRGTEKSTLYRIIKRTKVHKNTGMVAFECEHVSATLIDEQIDGYIQIGNRGCNTRNVIEYILDQQEVKNWVLGRCDFDREFEYGLDNETLYASLKSIAEPISADYKWTFDTTSYPWVINLDAIDRNMKPQSYFRYGKNILGVSVIEDSTNLATRLKCLGWGEGVNQLDITSVNGGSMYLYAGQANIDLYGLITYTWVDRRFTNAKTLKARGEVILQGLQVPRREYSLEIVNLFPLTTNPLDEPRVGDVTRCIDYELDEDIKTLITQVDERDIFGQNEVSICIANTPENIAGTIAEQADRLRNEQLYSQGSKSIYVMNFADNADPAHPAEIDLFIPSDVVNINYVNVLIRFSAFRAYSLTAAAGGGSVQATSNQPAQTSSAGGGAYGSTNDGGGGTSGAGGGAHTSTNSSTIVGTTSDGVTMDEQGDMDYTGKSYVLIGTGATTDSASGSSSHYHPLSDFASQVSNAFNNHTHPMLHKHYIATPPHQHSVVLDEHYHSISAHSHTVNIGAHTHETPAHGHTVNLQAHIHAAVYGIFEGGTASTATITIDGRTVTIPIGQDFDIARFLSVDEGTGKIRRGTSQKLRIMPNSLTRINATVTVGIFSGSMIGNVA